MKIVISILDPITTKVCNLGFQFAKILFLIKLNSEQKIY